MKRNNLFEAEWLNRILSKIEEDRQFAEQVFDILTSRFLPNRVWRKRMLGEKTQSR